MTAAIEFPYEQINSILPKLSPNGCKLFMLVMTKTAGFGKMKDFISYSQISDGTGISSKTTIKKAVEDVAKFITVNAGVGRSNMHEFDISPIIKGTETVPFNEEKGTEIELKGTETVPIEPIKGTVSSLKGTVFALKGTETVHTVVVPVKDAPEKFETLLARWFNNLGELGPREIELFGSYYDDHPEWTSQAIDETITAKPTGKPFRYFTRVINVWIKNGGPQDRPDPQPPPIYKNGNVSHPVSDPQKPQPGKFVPIANFSLG